MSSTLEKISTVYLKAGEMHCTNEPSVVVTVLGSCLSVTMYSPRHRIGGICHGLLPSCEDARQCANGCALGLRYVECAIKRMLALFDKARVRRSEIEVKCFGGADMFSKKIERPGLTSVGRQNILAAEKILTGEGLKIARQDVGGLRGRKIYFYTDTGEVLLKRLGGADDPISGGTARGSRGDHP